MKAFAWIPFALLLGIVIGGWGPRQDLKTARLEMERLQSVASSSDSTVRAVTDMIRIPPRETVAQETRDAETESPGSAPGAVDPSEESQVAQAPTAVEEERTPRNLRESIDEAIELWRVRSDIARNSFIARARLNSEQSAQFDVLVTAMNLRLRNSIEQVAARFQAGEAQTLESTVRTVNQLSGILALTYDEMDRTLPATWRMVGEGTVDLTDFIDPSVAEPLIGVEQRLQWREGRRGRRGRRNP